jgi:hypothetical protein
VDENDKVAQSFLDIAGIKAEMDKFKRKI